MVSCNSINPEINELKLLEYKTDSSMKQAKDCEVETENETGVWRPCIDELKTIIAKHQLNPIQLRYVFKKVREETKLVISTRPKSLPKFFTPAEAYQLMETARTISDAHSLLVQFLLQTGLRISEAKNLDLRDIKKDNKTLLVVNGKGKKDRLVPIGGNLIEKIFLFCKPRDKGVIFVHNKTQKPLSVRRLQQMYQEVCEEAGFGVKNPHTARHTFACLLINKGFKLEDIQLFMGHSSRVTTEVYAKLAFTPEQKDKYLQLFP